MRAVSVAFSPALRLAAEERAGDLARGVVPLLDVDGQRAGSRRRAGCPSSRCRGPSCRPARTTTAPLAWRASLPVSKEISLPPTSTETRLTSNMLMYSAFPSGRPVGAHRSRTSRSLSRAMLQGAQRCESGCAARSEARSRRRTRRRPGDAGADPALEVAPHALGDRLRAAIGARSARGRARARVAPLPQVRVVDCARIGVDRVDHLPEGVLAAAARPPRRRRAAPARAGACARPGSGGRRAAARSCADLRPGGRAVRAAEVGVDDQPPGPRRGRDRRARAAERAALVSSAQRRTPARPTATRARRRSGWRPGSRAASATACTHSHDALLVDQDQRAVGVPHSSR